MKLTLLIMALCASQAAGAQTQPKDLADFLKSPSVKSAAEAAKATLEWAFQFKNRMSDNDATVIVAQADPFIVKDSPIKNVTGHERDALIKSFLNDLVQKTPSSIKERHISIGKADTVPKDDIRTETITFEEATKLISESYPDPARKFIGREIKADPATGMKPEILKVITNYGNAGNPAPEVALVSFGQANGYQLQMLFFFRKSESGTLNFELLAPCYPKVIPALPGFFFPDPLILPLY
ncbi:MAG: hypothetical protein WEC83_01610 [Patescibacteria group bacterium]